MRAYSAPAALLAVSVAALGLLFVSRIPEGLEMIGVTVFSASAIGYVVATDWWLLRLRNTPVADGARTLRVLAILALGLPTAVIGLGLLTIIVIAGDNMWMVLPYAAAPPLLVWPFVISALAKVRRTPGAA